MDTSLFLPTWMEEPTVQMGFGDWKARSNVIESKAGLSKLSSTTRNNWSLVPLCGSGWHMPLGLVRQGKSKSLVMETMKIKTYNMKTSHDTNHFFLLSKGYNAGKPLGKSCFVITPESPEEKNQPFWVCYRLWKSGAYLPLLRGSVIPF